MGSSPLTRGKPSGRRAESSRRRLIPAHAGKTFVEAGLECCDGAHPRSRGENRSTMSAPRGMVGSSPLTRGKRSAALWSVVAPGLIPAHAGKTHPQGTQLRRAGAHPRSRGENSKRPAQTSRPAGSSPLTRGKPAPHRATREIHGLIPAHAGKTPCSTRALTRATAHPRSRGENVGGDPQELPDLGSSPLTRGKRQHFDEDAPGGGLIPAHAGKTRFRSFRSVPCPAHPRSRGENRRFPIGEYP